MAYLRVIQARKTCQIYGHVLRRDHVAKVLVSGTEAKKVSLFHGVTGEVVEAAH